MLGNPAAWSWPAHVVENLALGGLVLWSTATLATRIYIRLARRWGVMDAANPRSTHLGAVPGAAGVVFVVLWGICVSFWAAAQTASQSVLWGWLFWLAPCGLAWVGFLDDLRPRSVRVRLLAQAAAVAIGLICLRHWVPMPFAEWALWLPGLPTLLLLVGWLWSINLFNFMDGVDGFAATEAIFIFGVGGVCLWHEGGQNLAIGAELLVVLVAGFLVHNWPKASCFMGDCGSTFLGYLVVSFAMLGQAVGLSLWVWVMLYGLFFTDATITILRRIWAREPFYRPHLRHVYQRAYRHGWRHGAMLGWHCLGNLGIAALTLWAVWHPSWLPWAVVFEYSVLLMIYGLIERRMPMFAPLPDRLQRHLTDEYKT